MKSYLITLIVGSFLLFTPNELQAQNNPQSLISSAENYLLFSKNYPREKVYLHFDNTEYYKGETIWFKAYITRADRNSLSELSKVLYVELLSAEGNILHTKKLKVEEGSCHGEFDIAASGYGGFFEIRAYTRYMLNFGEENYFSRVFAVYDYPKDETYKQVISQRPAHKRIPQIRKSYNQDGNIILSFFPEGGHLVQGLTSTVSFKATGKNGESLAVSGKIFDENNEKKTEFSTTHNGMGLFSFFPENKKYYAKITYNGKNQTFPLPEIKSSGHVMSVNNFSKENIAISIQKSQNFTSDSLGLMLTCRGVIYGYEKLTWNNENTLYLSFPKKNLPSGVTQITLFDTQGEVLGERLIFVNHHSEMSILVKQNKQQYSPFEKIGLNFELKDKNGNPLKTSFSLAVRDKSTSNQSIYSNNIFTDLLLTSDLKGYIEKPNYYFEKDDKAHQFALDLLMLTQGWSRYVWKKMSSKEPLELKQPVEKGLYVEGTIKTLFRKRPNPNINVTMFMTNDSASQHNRAITDENGKFNFSIHECYGRQNMTIQTTKNNKRQENYIILDRSFSPKLKEYAYEEKEIPKNNMLSLEDIAKSEEDSSNDNFMDSLKKELSMSEKIHLLEEVKVKERRKTRREGELLRNPSIVYDVESDMDKMADNENDAPATILEYLEKVNPYFTFDIEYNTDNKAQIEPRYKGRNAIIILDGFLVKTVTKKSIHSDIAQSGVSTVEAYSRDSEELLNLLPDQIKSIGIVEEEGLSLSFNIALQGNEPIIYIYTYEDFRTRNSEVGIRQTSFQGYTQVKEFYNPPYNYIPPTADDHRRTLYWNPNVETGTEGKAMVTFYNNSSCKTIGISAETITKNGIVGTLNE